MKLQKILKDEKQFLALTSLRIEEFTYLIPHFEKYLQRYYKRKTTRGTFRINKKQKDKNLPETQDKLFFILTYLKLNPLQEHHAASFDISQSKVSKLIPELLKIFNLTMEKLGFMPCLNSGDFEDFITSRRKENKEDVFFIDVTEREIQRPENQQVQQENYSGKKKGHRIKNTLLSNQFTEILYLGPGFEGKTHDKTMADKEEIEFAPKSLLFKDLAYQGYEPENTIGFQATKKPKNKELSQDIKDHNQLLARIRIVIEHTIAGIKRARIIKEKIRTYKDNIRENVMQVCCALHNLRVKLRPKYSSNLNLIFCPI